MKPISDDARTDSELMLAARHDDRAFRELYDRWAERVAAYFYRRTWDGDAAADMTAETFAVVWKKRSRYTDTGRPWSAWLFAIAKRELRSYVRSSAVRQRAMRRLGVLVDRPDETWTTDVETIADAAEVRSDLAAAIQRLPQGQRNAVVLRVVEDMDYAHVAEALGCSEGAARVRVSRGLARLSQSLEAPS